MERLRTNPPEHDGDGHLVLRQHDIAGVLVSVQKQHLPSFRRMPESSNVLNSLDPGIRRDDVVSGKRVFLDGHYLICFLLFA